MCVSNGCTANHMIVGMFKLFSCSQSPLLVSHALVLVLTSLLGTTFILSYFLCVTIAWKLILADWTPWHLLLM